MEIGPDDWNELIKITNLGLITGSPVITTATFWYGTLFAKPPAVEIEKTRILMEAGVSPRSLSTPTPTWTTPAVISSSQACWKSPSTGWCCPPSPVAAPCTIPARWSRASPG